MYSRCRVCKRPLKTPESIRAGIGPICAGKRPITHNDAGDDMFIEPVFTPFEYDVILIRTDNGAVETNIPRSVIKHSPTGFEWGYRGSGPSDLALNILNAFMPPGTDNMPIAQCQKGQCSATAACLYQSFKTDFLVAIKHEGGVLRADDIRQWIANKAEQL